MNDLCPLIHTALGDGTTAEVAQLIGEIPQVWSRYRRGRMLPGAKKIAAWCERTGLTVTFLPSGQVQVTP